jgi:hypothetical protein
LVAAVIVETDAIYHAGFAQHSVAEVRRGALAGLPLLDDAHATAVPYRRYLSTYLFPPIVDRNMG